MQGAMCKNIGDDSLFKLTLFSPLGVKSLLVQVPAEETGQIAIGTRFGWKAMPTKLGFMMVIK